MDRLSIVLTFFTGSVITGGLAILFMTLGWYAWWAFVIAFVAGFGLSWPVAYPISRRIKRRDPNWDESKVDRVEKKAIPDPDAKEV